ncbi:hypothetical protein KKH43_02760 [Patescibacteria group bacterium]|nr:hypothetical protein [Patescibacteria group bacterium]
MKKSFWELRTFPMMIIVFEAIFWLLWAQFITIPQITTIDLYPILNDEIKLPFAISRAWDILLGPIIWIFLLIEQKFSERILEKENSFTLLLSFASAALILVFLFGYILVDNISSSYISIFATILIGTCSLFIGGYLAAFIRARKEKYRPLLLRAVTVTFFVGIVLGIVFGIIFGIIFGVILFITLMLSVLLTGLICKVLFQKSLSK